MRNCPNLEVADPTQPKQQKNGPYPTREKKFWPGPITKVSNKFANLQFVYLPSLTWARFDLDDEPCRVRLRRLNKVQQAIK